MAPKVSGIPCNQARIFVLISWHRKDAIRVGTMPEGIEIDLRPEEKVLAEVEYRCWQPS